MGPTRGSVPRYTSCFGGPRHMRSLHPPIIVLDDDPDTVTFLCDFFAMLGLPAVACPLGPDAAAWIAQHHPRLIILDGDLGDMTGSEVFRQIRADATLQTVPVIFFTGSEDLLRADLPAYQDHGAALVVKPDVEQLGALVQRLVATAA